MSSLLLGVTNRGVCSEKRGLHLRTPQTLFRAALSKLLLPGDGGKGSRLHWVPESCGPLPGQRLPSGESGASPGRPPLTIPVHSIIHSFPCFFFLFALFLFCFGVFVLFWGGGPCCAACGILAPRPGIEPGPSAVKARPLYHWTAGEFPPFLVNPRVSQEPCWGFQSFGSRWRAWGSDPDLPPGQLDESLSF